MPRKPPKGMKELRIPFKLKQIEELSINTIDDIDLIPAKVEQIVDEISTYFNNLKAIVRTMQSPKVITTHAYWTEPERFISGFVPMTDAEISESEERSRRQRAANAKRREAQKQREIEELKRIAKKHKLAVIFDDSSDSSDPRYSIPLG